MDERGNPRTQLLLGALANEQVREMLARFRAEGPSVLREFAGDPAIAGLMSSLSAARDSAGAGAGAGAGPNTSHSPRYGVIIVGLSEKCAPSTDYRHGSENGGTVPMVPAVMVEVAVQSSPKKAHPVRNFSSLRFTSTSYPASHVQALLPNRGSASAMKKQPEQCVRGSQRKVQRRRGQARSLQPDAHGNIRERVTSSASGHAMGGFRQARESSTSTTSD